MRRSLSLAGFALAILASCSGQAARDDALWPAARSAWPAVRVSVERGHETPPDAGTVSATEQIDDAVASGDRLLLRGVAWELVEAAAERGVARRIDAGEVSVGVATSLRERNRVFFRAIEVLSR